MADEESTLDQRSLSIHTCSRHTPPRRCQETELSLRLFAESKGRLYQTNDVGGAELARVIAVFILVSSPV